MNSILKEKWKALRENRIFKNYLWVFFGQNLGAVFSMLSLVVTLRIITTYDYGALVVIQTYVALISGIFGLRTFNGVIKYLTDAEAAQNDKLANQYVNTAFLIDLFSGILALVCGFALLRPITYLMEWEAQTVRYVGLYLPAVLVLPLINGTPVGVLRKLGKFKQVNQIHAFVLGAQLLVLIALWLTKTGGFFTVLFLYAFTEAIECVLLLWYSVRVLRRTDKFSRFWKAGFSKDAAFLQYNVFYGLTSTFDQVLGNVSTLLINRFIGNFATAYIKIITRICGLFTKVTNPINQVFYPELCAWIAQKRYRKALRVSVKYQVGVIAAGAVLIAALFSTYGWWISIFDPGMAAAKYQSLLYMVYTILGISLICINQLMFAMNMAKESLILVVVFDLLYLAALIPSIRYWGIYGYLSLQLAQLFAVAGGKYYFILRKNRQLRLSGETVED